MNTEKPLRILITGANGFVGLHLVRELIKRFGDCLTLGLSSRVSGPHPEFGVIEELDVTDAQAVDEFVDRFQPTHIVHLAGLAAIRTAIANTSAAWQTHLFGTLNVANAVLERAPDCVLIFIGSGQVYGATARSASVLTETSLLAPTNSYEITKAAADLAIGALAEQGLRCIRLRPFNHTGPNQSEDFVIPNFAMQIAKIDAGLLPPRLHVGNLEPERDFLDVRDVAAAYALAVTHADTIPSGTVMNISSGIPRRIGDLLECLLSFSATSIEVTTDLARIRPNEVHSVVGDSGRARALLNWSPEWSIEDTLRTTIESCRQRLDAAV